MRFGEWLVVIGYREQGARQDELVLRRSREEGGKTDPPSPSRLC